MKDCYYKGLNEQMNYSCVRNKHLVEKIASLADNIVERLSKPKGWLISPVSLRESEGKR